MRRLLFAACAALVAGGAPAVILGHSGATGVVKERMDAMKAMRDDLRALKAVLEGRRVYDAAELARISGDIAVEARRMESLFPEGTDHAPSEALSAVWSDPEGFAEAAEALEAAAAVLAAAAGAPDGALYPALVEVAGACKGCHEDYRQEDD